LDNARDADKDNAERIINKFYQAVKDSREGKTQKDRAQVYNSHIGKWVKIDTKRGGIVSVKKSPKPYENVKKYRKRIK